MKKYYTIIAPSSEHYGQTYEFIKDTFPGGSSLAHALLRSSIGPICHIDIAFDYSNIELTHTPFSLSYLEYIVIEVECLTSDSLFISSQVIDGNIVSRKDQLVTSTIDSIHRALEYLLGRWGNIPHDIRVELYDSLKFSERLIWDSFFYKKTIDSINDFLKEAIFSLYQNQVKDAR